MNRRAFTLLELLIFTAIFAVVMAGAVTVLVAVTRVQSRQSGATDVETQGQFVVQQIGNYVQSARIVDLPQDVATGTLTLREAGPTNDPTSITAASGTIYLQQGATGALQAMTTNKVTVSNLSFTRHYNLSGASTAYGTDSVTYSFTLAENTSNTTKQYQQSFQSSAAVSSPVGKIVLVQQAKGETNATGVPNVSATFPTANEAGDLLVVVVSNTGGSAVTITLSDTRANSPWTKIANPAYAAYNQQIAIFDALNVKNGTNTVTATFGQGVSYPSIFAYEYRGAATSSSFDATSAQTQSNSGNPSSGSATPSSAAIELILGALYGNPSTEIPAPGGGFTAETTSSVSATYVEDGNFFVTGPVSATWSYSQTTPSSSAVVVTFK